MAARRFRLQVMFWLDLHKSEESELADLIAELKERRNFSRAVRDGIRLIWSLGQGNLDVLLALFPWVEDAFYECFKEREPASDATLQQQLARLETLLLQQGNVPIETGPKKLLTPPVTPEDDDFDDNLLVIRKAASECESARNFLDAAFNLVQ